MGAKFKVRALTVQEIDNLVADLQVLRGAKLQDVAVGSTGVGLGLWTKDQGLIWLWFEGHRWSPLLLPLNRLPQPGTKPLKPLALFIKAHFLEAELLQILRTQELGRAMELVFANDLQIKIYLWPKHANLIAFAQGKRVAWTKISEQKSAEIPEQALDQSHPRSLTEILLDWGTLSQMLPRARSAAKGASSPPAPESSREQLEKQKQEKLKRLNRALSKVEEEISVKRETPWREAGDLLVSQQSMDLPEILLAFVDRRRSLSWNIENCFHRAKEAERKLSATLMRRDQLKAEIQQIESSPAEKLGPLGAIRTTKKGRGKRASEVSRAKFRQVNLPSGLVARVGRSAADNMQILRESRAWDYWLHLRDHPGSHAIISRERKASVSDQDFISAGRALIEQTFSQKAKSQIGQVFTLIISECRHVHPIRGDKQGRVTFRNERTMTLRYT